MAVYTRYTGDDPSPRVIHSSKWKTTKRQRTGISLMATGTQCVDLGPRDETKTYLKRAWKIGESLISASTQWTDPGLMAMSQ